MTFKEWSRWVKSVPWKYRWFIILVLLRPFIDQFYELKKVTPLLSPLYWAGILTILLSLIVILRFKTIKSRSTPYKVFLGWSLIYMVALILNFTLRNTWSLYTLSLFMKYITVIMLFFFLARFINTDRDLVGVMTTFLYSCFFVIVMILISGDYKIKGLYDTVQNIVFYMSLGYIVNTYLYLRRSNQVKKKLWKYFIGLILVLVSFVTLQHIATIVVVLVITLIFLYYSRRISLIAMASSVVLLMVFWMSLGDMVVKEYIEPQLDIEFAALQGEKESARMFHGRMSRWEVFIPMFFKLNTFAVGFGSAYATESEMDLLTESNIHNDYFRIMISSGVVGLFLYILFLYLLFTKTKYLKLPEKFLLTSCLSLVFLYSVTAYPSMYTSVMYVSLTIFAFTLNPVYLNKTYEKSFDHK